MRFLANINHLCNQVNAIKSSRCFHWYLPVSSNSIASNRLTESTTIVKTLPQRPIIQYVEQRFICSNKASYAKESSKPEKMIHFTDDHPDYVSIYQGKYTHQILRVKMFSLATSAMGMLAQPILWNKSLEVGGTGLGVAICSVAGVFTFITPLLLHFVTKKYVIDIKYNEKTDEYTCVTISLFLFKNEVDHTL